MFSNNAVVRSHSLQIDNKVVGMVVDIKKWRNAKKVAAKKTKKTEGAKKKAKSKLASA